MKILLKLKRFTVCVCGATGLRGGMNKYSTTKNRSEHVAETCRRRAATGNPPAVTGNPNAVPQDVEPVPVISNSPRSYKILTVTITTIA